MPRRSASGGLRRRSFEPLYREHHAFVWRCLRRFGVHSETDDAVQEVFVTAYRRLHTFEGRSSVRGWLAGIARKVAFRARRTDERRQRRHEALIPGPETDDIETWLQEREAEAFLEAFVDGLDADRRAVFILCDLEGLRGREAAESLGINQNTAYARLRSARGAFEHACAQWRDDGLSMSVARIRQAHAEAPPDDAQRRGWALLVTELGLGSKAAATATATAGTWLSPTKLLLVAAVAGGATVAASAASPDVLAIDGPDVRSSAEAQPETSPIAGSPRRETPPPPVAPHPARPSVAAPSPAVPTPPIPLPAKAVPVRPPSTSTQRAAKDPPAPPAETQRNRDDPSHITPAQYAALERARVALRAGDPETADRLAAAFLTTYPASGLSHDAHVLLVKARCRRNDPTGAAAAATELPETERQRLLAKNCPKSR